MDNPERVEQVFQDYKGRRAALIQALTSDVEEFRKECDPGKEKLCLYGLSSGSWDVNLPVEEVPPELPEPVLGINLIRDGMQEKDWISLIAIHSDAWLVSVAFYIASSLGFNKATRNQLFGLINSLPTVSEAVRNAANKQRSGNKEMSNSEPRKKRVSRPQEKFSKSYSKNEEEEVGKEEEVEEDEDEESLCGICEQKYEDGEFWICCDKCGKWFHGKCVKVTPAKAVHIKHYNCPSCSSNKKARTG